jgi:hypothetical protein
MNAAPLSIAWSPLVPWPVVAVLGAVAVALIALAAWRHARGVGWRALVAAALLLALAGPSVIRLDRDRLPDVAVVVVDDSASQAIRDRRAQTTAALDQVMQRLERLPDTETIVVHSASDRRIGEEDGTHLFEALADALVQVPRQRLAGVIMITDGQVHDVPATWDVDAPLHVLLTGDEDERDRRLTISEVPRYGIVDKPQEMVWRVDDLPGGRSTPVTVKVRQDGGAPVPVQARTGEDVHYSFTLDHAGPTVFEIEVEPGPGELTLQNNRAAVVVNGVRDRLRVLLVSGEPHAGERTWRSILKSDPSVDLIHFTILRPPEKQDGTPIRELSLIAFPTRELFSVRLDEFDLIIFDRYRRRGVLPRIYFDNVARYVENGGALLQALGPSYATPLSLARTPLASILPGDPTGLVFEGGYRARLSELGRRHPVTAGLPGSGPGAPTWGRWFRPVDIVPKGGRVLMTGYHDQPLLVLDRVGRGRVAQIASDQVWLWSRGFEGGGPQAELLRRLAHWLMKEPDLEEEDLRASVVHGELRIERRSLAPLPKSVEVERPDGSLAAVDITETAPGLGKGRLPVDQTGLYRVRDGERTALAAAGVLNPKEFADVRATEERLRPVVDAVGGSVHRIADGNLPEIRKVARGRERSGARWMGLLGNDQYVVTAINQVPLLPAPLVLVLVLAGLFLAWRREGR